MRRKVLRAIPSHYILPRWTMKAIDLVGSIGTKWRCNNGDANNEKLDDTLNGLLEEQTKRKKARVELNTNTSSCIPPVTQVHLDRSMDSDKYLEGQSMQRPPLFESDSFIYWKNRFETYVKSKDLDLWHVITNGDFQPIVQNPKTKLDEVIPFIKQTDDLKKRLVKNNEAKMVIYNALPRKEYERIFKRNLENFVNHSSR
ncbi:hypothetical protein Tco_1251984 [Tanacetum coccineum]